MDILNVDRGTGKSTYLIMRSHISGHPIITVNQNSADYLKHQAKSMNVSIPEPIACTKIFGLRGFNAEEVLVDEAPYVLQALIGKHIDTMTMSEHDEKGSLKPFGEMTVEKMG